MFLSALHVSPLIQTVWTIFRPPYWLYVLVTAHNVSRHQISNCTHMKEMTSCAAEDFSWEGIIQQWMFRRNEKEFIIMKLLRVEKLMYVHIKMSWRGLLQNLLDILGHGRTETGALFPYLFLLHLSFTFSPCFSLSPSPLLHCFPMLAFPECTATHRTSTRSQEHAK